MFAYDVKSEKSVFSKYFWGISLLTFSNFPRNVNMNSFMFRAIKTKILCVFSKFKADFLTD